MQQSYVKHFEKTLGYFKDFSAHPVFLPGANPNFQFSEPLNSYRDLLNSLRSSNKGFRARIDEHQISCAETVEAISKLDLIHKEGFFTILSILCHCYRWNTLPASEDVYALESLDFPQYLWQPFCLLADSLNAPYCGSLYSTTTSNFLIKGLSGSASYDFSRIEFDDLEVPYNWLPDCYSAQLAHWVKVFVFTEMHGGHVNKACISIVEALSQPNLDARLLEERLNILLQSIRSLTRVFGTYVRTSKLDVGLWRQMVQPVFIWGLATQPNSTQRLEGASGLQVGCIQLLDWLLGIEMQSTMGRAMLNSRRYLPDRFREMFKNIEPCRRVLKKVLSENPNPSITSLYKECLEAVNAYRNSHLQRGKIYIRGDGQDKSITTTGLSIQKSNDAIKDFERDMIERIQEVQGKLPANPS